MSNPLFERTKYYVLARQETITEVVDHFEIDFDFAMLTGFILGVGLSAFLVVTFS